MFGHFTNPFGESVKKLLAALTSFAALLLSAGIAHADAINNAINTHTEHQGMVQYLNQSRNLFDGTHDPDYVWNIDNVSDAVFTGNLYCNPVSPPAPFNALTFSQRKAVVVDIVHEEAPAIADQYLVVLNQLCTNY